MRAPYSLGADLFVRRRGICGWRWEVDGEGEDIGRGGRKGCRRQVWRDVRGRYGGMYAVGEGGCMRSAREDVCGGQRGKRRTVDRGGGDQSIVSGYVCGGDEECRWRGVEGEEAVYATEMHARRVACGRYDGECAGSQRVVDRGDGLGVWARQRRRSRARCGRGWWRGKASARGRGQDAAAVDPRR